MKLPPLNALRAFEAAARHEAFTLAAEELGVSSAAVSQQVRKLELYLGRKLFFRNNNQLRLTDAGRDLYANAAASLGQISAFTAQLLRPAGPRPLVISALPSLADRWLPAHLVALGEGPVRLRIEEDPVDLTGGEGVDIRLTYGTETYPGFWVRPLFQDALAPMAAPQLAKDWDAEAPDFGSLRLIEMDWGPAFLRTPKWADWCLSRGLVPPGRVAVTVPGGAAALTLAEAGGGVALGQLALAREALQTGRLVQLSQVTIPLPQPYAVVVAHARLRHERVKRALAAFAGVD